MSTTYENLSKSELLVLFKEQLLNFVEELIETFPTEGNLIMLRIFIENQLVIEDTLNIFATSINKNNSNLKNMIKARNEEFFLNYDLMKMDSKQKNDVNYMLKLWKSEKLEEEDKTAVWQWVDLFVRISESFLLKK
jgi:hypothetical protein